MRCNRDIIDRYNICNEKITIRGSVRILDDKIVIKDKKRDDIDDIYGYLKSRSFDYFPYPIETSDRYEVYPYLEDMYEPYEQKAMDLMHLLSLLHSKTTFYREVDIDRNKEIYENISGEIEYLDSFYSDLIGKIEKEVYMSPSSYLIARNINIIFGSIYFARDNLDKWYDMVYDKKNERVVNIHNNICLDHYIKSEKPYLISWNYSRIDSPIYDLLSFYRNHYLDFDFIDLFHFYEKSYPLKEEERILLFTYMAMPSWIGFVNDEMEMCIKINKMIEYMYKTSNLIMNYHKDN